MLSNIRTNELISGFGVGVLSTGVIGIFGLYSLNLAGIVSFNNTLLPELNVLLNDAWLNLRMSVIFFALVLLAFIISLSRLKNLLQLSVIKEKAVSNAEIHRADQLVTLCTTLFFGIGVIWTAIGLRSALLYALGDPSQAAQDGAFAILERMVEGGILLALSTTIVGGIGGYIMRIIKTLVTGRLMLQHYERKNRQDHQEYISLLNSINQQLKNSSPSQYSKAAP